MPTKVELHAIHPKQMNGINGHDVERYLGEAGFINRCLSLEDEAVKGWLAHPKTYPEEFKGKAVCLWKSVEVYCGNRCVACLVWGGGRVVVARRRLSFGWSGYSPAAMTS